MSDIRFDPISGHWVTIAPNRNDRPVEFIPTERIIKRLLCPFCAGNELETPATLASYDRAGARTESDDLSWLVRVVPNKYPSFSVAGLTAALGSIAGELDHQLLNDIEGLSVPTLENILVWTANRLSDKLDNIAQIKLSRPSLKEVCVLRLGGM